MQAEASTPTTHNTQTTLVFQGARYHSAMNLRITSSAEVTRDKAYKDKSHPVIDFPSTNSIRRCV